MLKVKLCLLADLPYFYRKAALQGGGGGALGASAAVNAIMVVNVMLYPMQVGTPHPLAPRRGILDD